MPDVKLLAATPADVPRCAKWSAETPDADFSETQLLALQRQGKLISVQMDDVLVGFLAESVVMDEAELLQVLIAPTHQGQGLGRQTLEAWHSLLKQRSVQRALLEVREGNEPAIRLYQSAGYEQVGSRKAYYRLDGKDYDGWVMALALTS